MTHYVHESPIERHAQEFAEHLLRDLRAAEAENERLREALEAIAQRRVPTTFGGGWGAAVNFARAALAARTEPHPDLDLLRKLADGTGGRRTGELMKRGWLRVEVTAEGLAALGAARTEQPPPSSGVVG